MRCEKAREFVGAWQDGELGAFTAWRVERHVRRCPECAAEADALARLEADLCAASPFGPEPRRISSKRYWGWQAVAAAGVAATLVFGVRVFVASRPSGTWPDTLSSAPTIAAIPPRTSPALLPTPTPHSPATASKHAVKQAGVSAKVSARSEIAQSITSRHVHHRRRHTWPSPVFRPMPQRLLKPQVAPTPETDRETILVATRTLTPEEIIQRQQIIEVAAQIVPFHIASRQVTPSDSFPEINQ